jgi:alkyldihydroxyacetonephosphate synthase
MRRWNGWGDTSIKAPVPAEVTDFLAEIVGPPVATAEISLEDICAKLDASSPSRLAGRTDLPAGVSLKTEDRLRVSTGQSLFDWIHLRYGSLSRITDGVVSPQSSAEVRAVMDWAQGAGVTVLICGGATSVVGHLNPPAGDKPCLTIDMRGMRRLIELDERSQLARFETGVVGPDMEAQLREKGFMLGHLPQSFEYASLGGFIATRSSGQQSLRYGRIDQMFAGGTVETPTGTLTIKPIPAGAGGPDFREIVLGSEGRIGVITEAVMRVTRLPEEEKFIAIFFPDWDSGMNCMRELAQQRIQLSMQRLSNPRETETNLRLAGHPEKIAQLERYLSWRGVGKVGQSGKTMMMIGLTGSRKQVAASWKLAKDIIKQFGGVSTGTAMGKKWAEKRFTGVYARNTLWDKGYAVDTMETCVDWSQTTSMMDAIEKAGTEALAAFGEKCVCYTHLSHVYGSGSSVYTTFMLRLAPDAEQMRARWDAIKQAANRAIAAHNGTVSHQHGVGRDHANWLPSEKGERVISAIKATIAHFDPNGLMANDNLTGPAA